MASVVVVSEFTVKNSVTGKGTRGSSPGRYVLDYMARDPATESLGPVGLMPVAEYPAFYEGMKVSEDQSVSDGFHATKLPAYIEGAAFDADHIALSSDQVKAAAADVQHAFDIGKTVFKTVVSFDQEYMKEHGLTDPDTQILTKGDWRQQADQLKMRLALQKGLESFSAGFDDLVWTGVIQTDTRHVHCHLCMYDAGHGVLHRSGQQRGKIPQGRLEDLKTAIESAVESMEDLPAYRDDWSRPERLLADRDRVRLQDYELSHGFSQRLVSLLPEDRGKWTIDSKDTGVRRARSLIKERFLQDVESNEDKKARIKRDAAMLMDTRGLSHADAQKMAADRMSDAACRQVLDRLKVISTTFCTPRLQAAASKTDDAPAGPLEKMVYTARKRKARQKWHTDRLHEANAQIKAYDSTQIKDPASVAWKLFWENEKSYQQDLVRKYDRLYDGLLDRDLVKTIEDMKQLSDLLQDMPAAKDRDDLYRQQVLASTLQQSKTAVNERLHDWGRHLDMSMEPVKDAIDPVQVMALDLHHMDVETDAVPPAYKAAFDAAADKRQQLLAQAVDWLQSTDQQQMASLLPVRDVLEMNRRADNLPASFTAQQPERKERRSATLALDEAARVDAEIELMLS